MCIQIEILVMKSQDTAELKSHVSSVSKVIGYGLEDVGLIPELGCFCSPLYSKTWFIWNSSDHKKKRIF
jgi:hypothetical protein